ncbi:MAG: hypothetical protein KJ000_31835, partial [Pirellulaceae bacterium]|nr:hypothetical protein [Pirellulaceae bacterium]
DSGIGALFGPAASGRGPLGGRGPLLVDRALDDLLQDDLRVSGDVQQRDEEDELRLLATGRSGSQDLESDAFFAQL